MKKLPRALSILSGRKSQCPDTSTSIVCDTAPKLPDPEVDHRWSELVPPTAGLAFGAVWDPDLGMVSFSGAELFQSSDDRREANAIDIPLDVNDNRSQILTIDQSTILHSENTATLAAFREAHPQYFGRKTPDVVRRRIPGSTLPSSTFGGFDIFLRNPRFSNAESNNRHYSCFDMLDKDLTFDPKTAFAEWEKLVLGSLKLEDDSVNDEGFFEGHQRRRRSGATEESAVMVELVLNSSFSTTTTSTSSYIEVPVTDDVVDDGRSSWSTIEIPKSSLALEFSDTWPHRRLKKQRPGESTAHPSEVLSREEYNHVVEPTSSNKHDERLGLQRLIRGLGRWKRSPSDDDCWVCVEVTQVITQRYV